jgi:hypothetical protein
MPLANVNLVAAKDLNMELCMSFCSTNRHQVFEALDKIPEILIFYGNAVKSHS